MEIGATLEQVSAVLADAAQRCARLAGEGDVLAAGDALQALQVVVNAAQAAQAELSVEFERRGGYEFDSCSSWKAWARDRMHLPASAAARLIRAGQCQREQAEVGELARSGDLSADHVKHLAFGWSHLDDQIMAEHSDTVLRVAVTDEPGTLRQVVVALRDAVHPEELDEAWIEGMAKEDVCCTPVPGGWHLNGFLTPILGAKFAAVLQSWAVPREASDERTPAQRRIDGLDSWLTATLASGLPVDRGVRPGLSMVLDLPQFAENPYSATAHLAGWGTIGPRMLQQMICESDFTPVLTAGPHTTLDVGRTIRLGTARQRTAIATAQGDRCVGRGCSGPVVHLHHVQWWSRGGPTDLSNLVGLCPRCHRLVHAGLLSVDPTTGTIRRPIARGATRMGSGCRRAVLPGRVERAVRARSDSATLTGTVRLRT